MENEKWMLNYCIMKKISDNPKDQRLYYTESGASIAKQIHSILNSEPNKSTCVETLLPNLRDIDKFKITVLCSMVEERATKSAEIDIVKKLTGSLT